MFRQWDQNWKLVFTLCCLHFIDDLEAGGGEFGQVGTYVPPQYVSGTCIVDPNDPFDPNARLQLGPLKGHCIDSRERRSALRILDPELRLKYFPNAESTDEIVAHIFHDNRYWIARIPADLFSEAILQVQYFPLSPLNISQIAHTQILLKVADGSKFELIEQAPQSGVDPTRIELREIIISIEVVGERGPGFSALKGVRDFYVQAYRLVSLDEKIEWMITKQNHRVKQWSLKLSPTEINEVFQNYIKIATQAGLTTTYHTLRANCSNLLAQLIDEGHQKPGWIIRILDSVSNLLPLTLKMRNVLGSRLPNLNDEVRHR